MKPHAPRPDDNRDDTAMSILPSRVQLCVNPSAGSWQRQRVSALKAAFERAGATVLLGANSSGEITIADNIDHVCAVGGDGTVRHVVEAVNRVTPPPTVSIFPLGTINLLARECCYTDNVATFVRRVLSPAPPRQHYVARIGSTLMLTCASVGPDSRTIALLSPRLKDAVGRAAYVAAFCKLLGRWPRHRFRLVTEGHDVVCEAVYIAKGRLFAGPWSFAPTASVEDPLLHVVALPVATRTAFFRFALAMLFGREPGGVTRFTCSRLSLVEGPGAPLQADGDIIAHLPVTITMTDETIAFS